MRGEFFAGDVDGFKPIELFFVIAAAHIHHQFIVEYLLFFRLREIVEVLEVVSKYTRYILAERYRALLAIHDLIGNIGICISTSPIHHV